MERKKVENLELFGGLEDLVLPPGSSTIRRWEEPKNSLSPENLPASTLDAEQNTELPKEVLSAITPAGIKAFQNAHKVGRRHLRQRLFIICEEVLVKGAEGVSLSNLDKLFHPHRQTQNYSQMDRIRTFKFIQWDRPREIRKRDWLNYPTEATIALFERGLISYTTEETLRLLAEQPELKEQVRFLVESTLNDDGEIKPLVFMDLFDQFGERFRRRDPEETLLDLFRKGFIETPAIWDIKVSISDKRLGISEIIKAQFLPSYEAVRLYKDGLV